MSIQPASPQKPVRNPVCRSSPGGAEAIPHPARSGVRPAAAAALLAAVLAALLTLLVALTVDVRPTDAALPAAPADRLAPARQWGWPLAPAPAVVRPFDKPGQRWLAGHRGVDLAASAGDAVRSPADGTVRFTGYVVDRQVLTVDHGDGTVSSFEPVTATVSVGEPVTAGQSIGVVDFRGSLPGGAADGVFTDGIVTDGVLADGKAPESRQPHCPRSCLHWGVRLDGEYVDPLRYLMDRRPSVLLPPSGGRGSPTRP